MTRITLLLYPVAVVLCTYGVTLGQIQERAQVLADVAIEPDPTGQERIKVVVDALRNPKLSFADRMASVGSIKDWIQKDTQDFFEQLLYFYCRYDQQSGDESRAREVYSLTLPSFFSFSEMDMLHVLVPYLDSDNIRLQSIARNMLEGYIEGPSAGSCVDYDYYRRYIAAHKERPPLGLVRYMYRHAPGPGVLALARVYCRPDEQGTRKKFRAILWAEHVVNDALWRKRHRFLQGTDFPEGARRELKQLSEHDDWWVRLYVAQIMRQHRGFRQPEIIERLKKDNHPLVREAIRFADKMPTKKPGRD